MRGAATYGSQVVLSRIGNRIVATAQRRVFDRLLKQNIAYFQDRHSSEFIARLAFAANGVRDALQLVIQGFARDLVSVAGLVFVMIERDPMMALGALSRCRSRRCSSAASSGACANSPSARSTARR